MSTRTSRANDAEKHAKTLQELLKLPENKYCADCGDKGPRWASVNLGIFICMRCAGIHRQMGTHVSKVKSTTLDSWIDEWVERMSEVGNEKANQVWEATNPSRKPTPQSNQPDLERFLRDKYERGMFKSDSGSHDRHGDRHHHDRHGDRHHHDRHEHDRRREANRNTDFPPEDHFDARFDARDDVIGSSRSAQGSSKQGGSQQAIKIQIKTGGAPPLPARTANQPVSQPQAPAPVQAPKVDSLFDLVDSTPISAPAQTQPQQAPAAVAQSNGQDNFAAFPAAGFGDFGTQGDFNALAAGKSTTEKKNDIMKMFESAPANPMMGMGMGMNGMGMGMGMGMNQGGMGMGVGPQGMGMGMGMNQGAMGMNQGMGMGMGMNQGGMGMGMGVGPQGMGMGMGMNQGGMGMNHQAMGMNHQGMGMGMNMGMGAQQARPGGMPGHMGMGMGMAQGNPMAPQQPQQPFGQPQQPFGQPQQPFGQPQQGNAFAGMFGM